MKYYHARDSMYVKINTMQVMVMSIIFQQKVPPSERVLFHLA